MITVLVACLAASCSSNDPVGVDPSVPESVTSSSASPVEATVAVAQPEVLRCAEPFTIGVVTDLTGGLQVLGSRTQRAVAAGLAFGTGSEVLAGDEQVYNIDECEIHLHFHDDQSSDVLAAAAASALIKDAGASLLIGASTPSATAAIKDVAAASNVVLLAIQDTPQGLTGSDFDSSSFLLVPSADQRATAVCEASTDGTAVVVAMDYPIGRRIATAFQRQCDATEVLLPSATAQFDDLPAAVGSSDLLALAWEGSALRDLVAAALSSDVGTVNIGSLPPRELAPLLLSQGVGAQAIAAHWVAGFEGAAADHLVAAVGGSGMPDSIDAVAMNAGLLAVAALRRSGGDPTNVELVSALEGIQFEGVAGSLEIRASDHMLIQDLHIVEVVDPAAATYELRASVRPVPRCELEGEYAARCG